MKRLLPLLLLILMPGLCHGFTAAERFLLFSAYYDTSRIAIVTLGGQGSSSGKGNLFVNGLGSNATIALSGMGLTGGNGQLVPVGIVYYSGTLDGIGSAGGVNTLVVATSSPGSVNKSLGGIGVSGSIGNLLANGFSPSISSITGRGSAGGGGIVTSTGLVFASSSLVGKGGTSSNGILVATGASAGAVSGSATIIGYGAVGGSSLTSTMQASDTIILIGVGSPGNAGTITAASAGGVPGVYGAIIGQGGAGGASFTSVSLQNVAFDIDSMGGITGQGNLVAAGTSAGGGSTAVYNLSYGSTGSYGVITASGLVFAANSIIGQGGVASNGVVSSAIGVINGSVSISGLGGTGSFGTLLAVGQHYGAVSMAGIGSAASNGTLIATGGGVNASVAPSGYGGTGSFNSLLAVGLHYGAASLTGYGGGGSYTAITSSVGGAPFSGATDTFDGSGALSSNWTLLPEYSSVPTKTSGQIVGDGTVRGVYYNASGPLAAQSIQADITVTGMTGDEVVIKGRQSTSLTSNYELQCSLIDTSSCSYPPYSDQTICEANDETWTISSAYRVRVFKYISGSGTPLFTTDIDSALGAISKLRLEINGANLVAKAYNSAWNTLTTISNETSGTTTLASGYAGIAVYGAVTLDNFSVTTP